MHDLEKSDSAIVAVKPANKAGPPVAEVVVPRAGTKGNADQQSTHRTQIRERVTQALTRVRQAARQRKKERFPLQTSHPAGVGCSPASRRANIVSKVYGCNQANRAALLHSANCTMVFAINFAG